MATGPGAATRRRPFIKYLCVCKTILLLTFADRGHTMRTHSIGWHLLLLLRVLCLTIVFSYKWFAFKLNKFRVTDAGVSAPYAYRTSVNQRRNLSHEI